MKPTIEEVRAWLRVIEISKTRGERTNAYATALLAALDVAEAQSDCGHEDCLYARFRKAIRPTPPTGSTSGGKE